jgi:hypothetical protein
MGEDPFDDIQQIDYEELEQKKELFESMNYES